MWTFVCNFRWHIKCVLTKLCCDASSISNVCICRDKSPSSVWAPWRASVFCDTCTCTSAIWKEGKHGERGKKEISCKAVTINALLRPCYLVLMPALEVICILRCNLLVVGPHILYDLGQVLTFGSVHVDLHAWPGDLIPQLHDVLLEQRKERGERTGYVTCYFLSRVRFSFWTHILVVLLQVGELLPHRFNLALNVYPGQVGVIQDFLQPSNVGLHRLPDGQLIVEPVGVHTGRASSLTRCSCWNRLQWDNWRYFNKCVEEDSWRVWIT